jgi:hypothetical protein
LLAPVHWQAFFREWSPGPLAPEVRIMPLDQAATCGSSWATGGTPSSAAVSGASLGSPAWGCSGN